MNYAWIKRVINALWDYSHELWVARCKELNLTTDDASSLTRIELLQLIRKYLKIPCDRLSTTERKLHLNVTK